MLEIKFILSIISLLFEFSNFSMTKLSVENRSFSFIIPFDIANFKTSDVILNKVDWKGLQ